MKPRVLVEVSGGVAWTTQTPDVEVLVIDYDNEPDAVVPEEFKGLGGLS